MHMGLYTNKMLRSVEAYRVLLKRVSDVSCPEQIYNLLIWFQNKIIHTGIFVPLAS